MPNSELTSDNNLDTLCIPLGAAVSAKFRGAFCEAIVSKVDMKLYCRIQLDDKKTVKVRADDIIGVINTNSKVKVRLNDNIICGIILKIIDNSMYHVVFNDDDTGILRRNQLVLKGDRHYKLSECLDRQPLMNPEQFTKAVINEKRLKDKSDVDEEEFDNEEAKSCSQESMTTVSSSKTRSRQQTIASSASVGTGGSSTTVKTLDDVNKTKTTTLKSKKNINVKYSIGSLVFISKVVAKLGILVSEKLDKKVPSSVGLIVTSTLLVSEPFALKPTQCLVKSFRDNNCYIAYKRDLEVIQKRDILLRYKQSDPSLGGYIEKCILFFDAKILPENWDMDKLLPQGDYHMDMDIPDSDRSPSKKISKLKHQSPRTSLSSLDSQSDNDDEQNDGESEHSNEDDQNAKDEWVARFFGFWEDKGSPINNALEIMGSDVDIYRLYELVKDYGGFQKVTSSIRWPHLYHLMKLSNANSENYQKLQMLYKRYIFPYVDMKKKLGTFEQIRNRRVTERAVPASVRKPRPLLTARERREYQVTVKKETIVTGGCSVSDQSAGERLVDARVASGDEGVGGGGQSESAVSGAGEGGRLSQCSSTSVQADVSDVVVEEGRSVTSLVAVAGQTGGVVGALGTIPPGTLVSVAYGGDDKIYKAKIIHQHTPHTGPPASGTGHKSPCVQARPQTYQPMVSIDSISNADSTTSTTGGNDPRSDTEASTLYRVHYIGWNNRHDEIIGSDRIVAVLSDTGQDSQSVCSSKGSQHMDQGTVQALGNTDEPSVTDANDMLPDISDVSHDPDSSDSGHANDMESKLEPVSLVAFEPPSPEHAQHRLVKSVVLKRRRSRSACVVEPAHITIKRLPILPESRMIASLDLYKTGDKMPKRPIKKQTFQKEEKIAPVKKESDHAKTESSSGSKRHSTTTDESETSHKIPKVESLKPDKVQSKTKRVRSPSFSNESLSDASTISFRNVDEQSLYYLSVDEDGGASKDQSQKPLVKIGNKRGRKPLHKHDKKLPGSTTRKIREQKFDAAEIESTSSQHSGSGHGKRVTRSLKTASDQNTVDDNSMQLEEDSQTSQDGSGFQLPPTLLSDSKHSLMIPLATGTPTSSHKGRRPKSRRKLRNSQSNSSVECAYQDSIGDAANYSFTEHFSQPKLLDNSPILNSHIRPPGRSFQRLHPSLIPNDLQKLPPEERVKLLESLIRQTHLNFLDTKDKIKYVERRISEIKSSRANGHSVESDEDKFR